MQFEAGADDSLESLILLVVDETRIGFGRTGRMFCCEHADVVPDLLLAGEGLASGIPSGVCIAYEPAYLSTQTKEIISGCNPLASVAALVTIELLNKQYLGRTQILSSIALGKLQRICKRQRCLASPRGLGLLLAVDVITRSRSGTADVLLRDHIIREAFSRGLLLRPCGESGILFAPPLSINRVQLEVGLDVFSEVVQTVII